MSRRPPNPTAATAANGPATAPGQPGLGANLAPAGTHPPPAMRMSPNAASRQLPGGVPVMMMQGGAPNSNVVLQQQQQQQQAAAMRNARISSLRIVTMDGYPPEYLFHLHPMLGIIRPEPNMSSPMIPPRALPPPRPGSSGSDAGKTTPGTAAAAAAAAATLTVGQPAPPAMNANPNGGRARPAGFHQRSSSLGYTSGSRRQDLLVATLQARSREVIWDPIGRVGPFRIVTFDRGEW
ncbi:hypothetical protein SYNPS1DRAFT_29938 [Syncephalis pseudoplumigaleata]|uniref:Uncharacterized protein n=1 Tax=Syncephalis pseudoplumigaleata TaxID=1712513 RepID=A0A4P9YWR1_9FUNG|nr:hypothetical protein SYNPS1DRAFT_29938 [Syncephalis pseudoplumigaleata]|eukprot:RKP24298.1 hypothetical protein SYNPS1DRAFT_29938 [Syncephalis pseudoplumigaleata]